jgi:hypothetical protein
VQTYGAAYIQLMYTFYLPPRWCMWQAAGFMQEFRVVVGLDIAAPSFGQMGDRFAPVELRIRQRCKQLAACSLLLAGLGATRPTSSSTARARTSGGAANGTNRCAAETPRAPWRKAHLSIDPDMNVRAIAGARAGKRLVLTVVGGCCDTQQSVHQSDTAVRSIYAPDSSYRAGGSSRGFTTINARVNVPLGAV